MKLKEKFQRFWTLSKSREGFTLVELIVVIAILAILAGVAIPVYNGYIKKAQESADQQVLDSINTAFAAACLDNGYDHTDVWAQLTVDANGFICKQVSGNYEYALVVKDAEENVITADVVDSFAFFFAGNETSYFKGEQYVNQKLFLDEYGSFTAVAGKNAVTINGKTYYVSQTAIDNFKNAGVFSENIGTMQGQVDSLSTAYGELVADFVDELGDSFGEDYAAFLDEMNVGDDPTKIGNATVLYVAEQSKNMTAQDAMDKLCNAAAYLNANAGGNPRLMDVLNAAGATGDPLSTAAMMYGAVTAYANGTNDAALKEQAANVSDAGSLLSLFQSAAGNDDFLTYCGSYELDESTGTITSTNPSAGFVTDMNGYLGALEAMSSVSGEINVGTEGVWSGESVDELLAAILGSN